MRAVIANRVGSARQKRVFIQTQFAIILERFLGGEKQQTEGAARPAIVVEPAIEAFFLRPSLLVNGLWRVRLPARYVLDFRVIRFKTTLQRIDQRAVRLPALQSRDRAAISG